MITFSNDNSTLKLSDIKTFKNFSLLQPNCPLSNVKSIREVFITGSLIDCWEFLYEIFETAKVEKLVFLACKSNVWDTLTGHVGIRILRLHNLKPGKGREYLQEIDFVSTFSSLEYLYIKMLGITTFPDLSTLKSLHTIACSNYKLADFSTLEALPNLTTFIGWPETDSHKTPAEAFIPILKNPSLKAFDYNQTNREDKRLKSFVEEHSPNIDYPMTTITDEFKVNNDKVMEIIPLFF